MESLAAIGVLAQTPAGQGALAIWTIGAGAVAWVLRWWLLPPAPDRKMLVYTGLTHRVVAPEKFGIPSLEVFVNGTRQPQVAVTKVAVWNNGLKTIRPDDIASSDRLRLVVSEGTKVLSADVLVTAREASAVQIEPDEDRRTLLLKFDFLANRDGAVIRLVHDGSPRTTKVSLLGTLIEGDRIEHVNFEAARIANRGAGTHRVGLSKSLDMMIMLAILGGICVLLLSSPLANGWGKYVIAATAGPMAIYARGLLRLRWQRLHPYMPEEFEGQVETAVSERKAETGLAAPTSTPSAAPVSR